MLILFHIFLSLAVGFLIAFFIIPKIIRISKAKHLFDVPNDRSASKVVVPTLGGIAIFAGFRISQIISLNSYNTNELKYMSASVLVMFLVGLKDDIVGISAKWKLLIQFLIAAYLVFLGDYRITNLHDILGITEISYVIGSIISIIIIVGIINSLNLIDGVDGLAAGTGILISAVFGGLFLYAGDVIYALTSFSLTGALIAFSLYNVYGKTNKIFMGDTGSLILGVIVATLTIHFNEFVPNSNIAAFGSPAISLAIIILPVVDTLRVIAIRISQKKSPFSPDMNHIHHQVLKLAGSHLQTSHILIAINALIVFISLYLIDILGENILFFTLLISGFIFAAVPVWILRFKKKNTSMAEDKKSVFAISIFTKLEKD